MSNFISLRNIHLYPLTEDSKEKLEYGNPIAIPGAVKVEITPEVAENNYYADGILYEAIKKFAKASITMQTAAINLKTQAEMCGHEYDEGKNKVVCNEADTPPYFGRKYERVKANGESRYIALNKVVFGQIADNGQTAGESVEWQDSGDIVGTAMATINNGNWKDMMDTSEGNAEDIKKFFESFLPAE